jgi:hypothetical protein
MELAGIEPDDLDFVRRSVGQSARDHGVDAACRTFCRVSADDIRRRIVAEIEIPAWSGA